MSTPRLSREMMVEAIEAYKRYGSVTEAARALGLPRNTFNSRLTVAKAQTQEIATEEYIPPEVLSEDIDLEELLDQLEVEEKRIAKARASVEWMEFQVLGTEPFALVFVGDPHADQCSISLLRRHLQVIEDTPRMWAVGLGDWINQWAPKLRGQYAFQSITERNALRIAQWMFEKPIWWAIILGNHNGGRWHGDGAALKWMQTACPTPVQEWQAKFTIKCGEASWKIWAAHNFPGGSIYNANHGPDKRALFTGAIADMFVAGDRHVYKRSHDQHEHTGRMYWSCRAKGYKRMDLYAEELGYSGKQSTGHSIAAVFDPRDGTLECFGDVEKGAEYLTLLRGAR